MKSPTRHRADASASQFMEIYHGRKDILLLSDYSGIMVGDQVELRALSDEEKVDMGIGYLLEVLAVAPCDSDIPDQPNALILVEPDHRPLIPWLSIGRVRVHD